MQFCGVEGERGHCARRHVEGVLPYQQFHVGDDVLWAD